MRPYVLEEANANLVIIGCGSPVFIRPYKGSFHPYQKTYKDVADLLNLPYQVYANPSGSLYKTLGMQFQKGINKKVRSFYLCARSGGSGLLDRSGSHGTFLDTILKGIARSLRMGKIFAPAGEVQRKLNSSARRPCQTVTELGGEFVFSKYGRKCRYAHRMKVILSPMPPIEAKASFAEYSGSVSSSILPHR
jgi:hypothetical protein